MPRKRVRQREVKVRTPEELEQINMTGFRAFTEYYETRGRLWPDLKRNSSGHLAQPHWEDKYWRRFLQIAETCLNFKWDVTQYIRTALTRLAKDRLSITPCDLVNATILSWYIEFLAAGGKTGPRAEWQAAVETVMRCVSRPRVYPTENSVLMNSNVTIPAWFRVLYPEQPSAELVDIFGALAFEQLRSDWTVRAFARQIRPENFNKLQQRFGILQDA